MFSFSTSVSEIQRKTTFLYDNKNNPVASQAAATAQPFDQSLLHQINDGVRNLKLEMTNRVSLEREL